MPVPVAPSLAEPIAETIVVVDDDAAVLNALDFALEAEGFKVRAFRSAAALFAAPDVDGAACLVIDQNLPDELGLDLLTRLRARGDATPAVIITTNPPRTLLAQAKALQAPVVEKPLLDDRLFACIRQLSAGRSGRPRFASGRRR